LRLLSFCLCLWGVGVAVPSQASGPCDDAIRTAARITGVPLQILQAVALTETGRERSGQMMPWPWVFNLSGRAYWFDTEAEAKQFLRVSLPAERPSIDIGCFQINAKWHGGAFPSLEAMLSPPENAVYAASFLSELYLETGDWRTAVGKFHSRQSDLGASYIARVEGIFETYLAADAKPAQPIEIVPNVGDTTVPQLRHSAFSLRAARGPIVLRSGHGRFLPGGP
jgi:hypothetical protein